jgi:imidazoleglycerol-phosphate dehydratase
MKRQNKRSAEILRETKETRIRLRLILEGSGRSRIETPIPFLNHMLELLTHHGSFDLSLKAEGDIDVGYHHTVEDIGICLGDAFSRCWGDLKHIRRYGSALLPMDESLVMAVVDISRRPHLSYGWKPRRVRLEGFDTSLIKEFFQALVNRSAITLHLRVLAGENLHHIIEAMFKGFGRAVAEAGSLQDRGPSIRSSKGLL